MQKLDELAKVSSIAGYDRPFPHKKKPLLLSRIGQSDFHLTKESTHIEDILKKQKAHPKQELIG
jgi:hypothetical protein